jgi:hypothetical protein
MNKGIKGRSPAINSIGQRPMNETRAAAIAPTGRYSDCALAGLRFLFAFRFAGRRPALLMTGLCPLPQSALIINS